jgi:histidine ammonia-lyase
VVDNVTRVLAVELLAACQAMDFLKPLKSSRAIETARRIVRRRVKTWTRDRFISPDLEAGAELVEDGFSEILATLE